MKSPEIPRDAPVISMGGVPRGIFPKAIGDVIEKTAWTFDSNVIAGIVLAATGTAIALGWAKNKWNNRSRPEQKEDNSPPSDWDARVASHPLGHVVGPFQIDEWQKENAERDSKSSHGTISK